MHIATEIHYHCISKYGDNDAVNTFCFCISRTIVNNIREKNVYVEDLGKNIDKVLPSKEQVSVCKKEAGQ